MMGLERLGGWLRSRGARSAWRGAAATALAGAAAISCSPADQASPKASPADGAAAAVPASPQQRAWEAIAAGALLVDVRTEAEFAEGHLPGAANIPVGELASRLQEVGPDTARTIVLYCRSGSRSSRALAILRRAGYNRVMDGGGLAQMRAAQPPAR